MTEAEFKNEVYMKKLFFLRYWILYNFIGFGINYIENSFFRKVDLVKKEIQYINWIIQLLSLIGLILTKIWALKVVIPLMFLN